ncbi:hypothetical protein KJ855_01550 [Patescibacteria group bacterium]|nr:hypothetical protein [Patescibacteria group bacterium]
MGNIDISLVSQAGLIIAIILIIYFWFFAKKTPAWLQEYVNYLNLAPTSDKENLFSYSKFFEKHHRVSWQYLYHGKHENIETNFGSFVEDRKTYFCLLMKSEVKPMILTNSQDEYRTDYQYKIKIGQMEAKLFSKEKYLVENIVKSGDFRVRLSNLFIGKNNWLEFTELNQMILITDYQFTTGREALDYFANFKILKEEM